jgi:hypothetical protein
VEALGVILQLVGGAITVFGLWETKNALFPGERRLLRLWQQARGRMRRLFGRRGELHEVTGTISGGISMSGSAFGYVSPGPDATLEERVKALEGRAEVFEAMRADEAKRLSHDRQRVDQLEGRIGEVERAVPVAIGGERGAGLTTAGIGVLVSMFGTFVAALG